MAKFKPGDLCRIVYKPGQFTFHGAEYLGEIVTVVSVCCSDGPQSYVVEPELPPYHCVMEYALELIPPDERVDTTRLQEECEV